jgi:uncharacterized oxidoreductase
MLSIYLDPAKFRANDEYAADINRFIAWVKSSKTVTPDGEILMPGEIEERTKARRLRDGIYLDAATVGQIAQVCASRGVRADELGLGK